MLGKILDRWQLLRSLGIFNVFRVAIYRVQVRSGWFRKTLPIMPWPGGEDESPFVSVAPEKWPFQDESVLLFGHQEMSLSKAPNWTANHLEQTQASKVHEHWSCAEDFNASVGDIKGVWELSRFQAVLSAAWRVANSESKSSVKALDQVRALLNDWCLHNPPNRGPNWKCAQEASIRVMHALYSEALCEVGGKSIVTKDKWQIFIEFHLRRILPTTHYAKAQDNNHGTSEAGALFCGGLWIEQKASDSNTKKFGTKAKDAGRRLLENRSRCLIMSDGTFSQYSPVYHRMMLDTLVFAELWRLRYGEDPFSHNFYTSCLAATQWISDLVDEASGDCPNIGSNDGAHLFNASGVNYRDFNVSAEVASHVFNDRSPPALNTAHSFYTAFPKEIKHKARFSNQESTQGPATTTKSPGGFVRLGEGQNWAAFRLPGYRFRPPQADALHLDVWCNGINLCPDAGTFAYNLLPDELDEFSGTGAHNTVCFDNKNQMPRVSRFLFGKWLHRADFKVDRSLHKAQCGYIATTGGIHHREVKWTGTDWLITDRVDGHFEQATLRWRLADLEWTITGDKALSDLANIVLDIDGNPATLTLETVRESRYYRKATLVPSITLSVSQPCVIRTRIIPNNNLLSTTLHAH